MVADPAARPTASPLLALLRGAATVGVIDFLYATTFVVLKGRPWYRPWQGVASAVLGPASYDGGMRSAALGVCLHFCVATCIVAVYLIAARGLPVLRRRTLLAGVPFGVVAFFVMNLAVVPLTRIGFHPLQWNPFNVGGLLVHALLIGPAAAFFAGRAWRDA